MGVNQLHVVKRDGCGRYNVFNHGRRAFEASLVGQLPVINMRPRNLLDALRDAVREEQSE